MSQNLNYIKRKMNPSSNHFSLPCYITCLKVRSSPKIDLPAFYVFQGMFVVVHYNCIPNYSFSTFFLHLWWSSAKKMFIKLIRLSMYGHQNVLISTVVRRDHTCTHVDVHAARTTNKRTITIVYCFQNRCPNQFEFKTKLSDWWRR